MRFCPACHSRYDAEARFCPRDGERLPEDPGDERIGTVLLGQFELLEICGQGQMGTVYRAWQTGMERQVAIKVLRPELASDAKLVARFDREARAVAKLTHPNIVTFYLVGAMPDGAPFLAMEYVEGAPLSELLEKEPILETGRVLAIARQITSALADAHAEGIVHRDLKPANILIAPRRRMPDFVKLLDFGIAKVLRGEEDLAGALESRLSRTGTIFGTPHYIAPEQAAGADVDHRADLYSLGVILYRAVTGKLPFDGSGMSVLLAHMSQPLEPPHLARPDLDPGLETLILRALEKDPKRRFQSAEEMTDALDALGAREDTSAPSLPPERSEPIPLVAPRRSVWKTGALGLVLGGASAAAVYLVGSLITRPAPAAATPAPVVAAAPDGAPAHRPGYRVVVVGENGYAVRVQVPKEPRVGVSYELIFDVIEPDGTPADEPELPATMEEPGGKRESFLIEGAGGHYVATRTFSAAGRVHVHLYPIPDQPKVHIWFDFDVLDENGLAVAPLRVARPPAPRATSRPPLPPILGNLGKPPEPLEGMGETDPYHIVTDEAPVPPERAHPRPRAIGR
jgi:serine/threonine-protein kinase